MENLIDAHNHEIDDGVSEELNVLNLYLTNSHYLEPLNCWLFDENFTLNCAIICMQKLIS